MLTEDDDALLLAFDTDGYDVVKSQVKDCVAGLLNRLSASTSSAPTNRMEASCSSGIDGELEGELHSFLSLCTHHFIYGIYFSKLCVYQGMWLKICFTDGKDYASIR